MVEQGVEGVPLTPHANIVIIPCNSVVTNSLMFNQILNIFGFGKYAEYQIYSVN